VTDGIGTTAELKGDRTAAPSWLSIRFAVETLAIAALYAVFGYVGQLIAVPPGNVTIVWPPSGIALAGVLLIGVRAVPGIVIGAVIVNGWTLLGGADAGAILRFSFTAGVIGVGSALQAVVGAKLVRRFIGHGDVFDSLPAAARFFAIAPAMCLVSASFGAPSLAGGGYLDWSAMPLVWATWWFGDPVGVLVFAPLSLSVARMSPARSAVMGAIFCAGIGSAYAISESMKAEAEAAWNRQAEETAERLTATLLHWLDLSYAPLSALATVFAASEDVDEDEFLDAIDILESSETGFVPASVAFLRREAGGEGHRVVYSTDEGGDLGVDNRVDADAEARLGIAPALDRPGDVFVGALSRTAADTVWGIASIAVETDGGDGVLVAHVNVTELIEGLFEVEVPEGVSLRLVGRPAGTTDRSVRLPLHGGTSPVDGTVMTISSRAASGGTELWFYWDVTTSFIGGPSTQLASVGLIGGVVLTVLVTVFVGFLFVQTEKVHALVRERTAELAEKQSQLSLALDNMSDGMFLMDRAFRYALVNRRYHEQLGLPPGIMEPGKPVTDVIRFLAERGDYGEVDVEERIKTRLAQLASRETQTAELQLPDGRVLELRQSPTADGGTIVLSADVTERREAEDTLRESEARLESILDASTAGTTIVRKDGTVEYANPRVLEMFGLSLDELLAINARDVYADPKDRDRILDEIARTGFVRDAEILFKRKDGSLFWVLISFQEVEIGGEAKLLTSIYEITELKEARGQLETQVAELDRSRRASLNIMKDVEVARKRAEGLSSQLEDRVAELDKSRKATLNIMEDVERARTHAEEMRVRAEEAFQVVSDSINYASGIQRSLLPPNEYLAEDLTEHFILWEPRDVVGGDLYWYRRTSKAFLVILADCTGHGVPGAFMTMISTGALDRALRDQPDGDPARLLHIMNRSVKRSLGQDRAEGESDDGLELGICRVEVDAGRITFAGARFSLFRLGADGVEETKGDKSGIGYRAVPLDQTFTNHDVAIANGDVFYMTTDGLIDQIGGEKRRSFGKRRFGELVSSLTGVPLADQKARIVAAFEEYQGSENRRDDVSVIGFKV